MSDFSTFNWTANYAKTSSNGKKKNNNDMKKKMGVLDQANISQYTQAVINNQKSPNRRRRFEWLGVLHSR